MADNNLCRSVDSTEPKPDSTESEQKTTDEKEQLDQEQLLEKDQPAHQENLLNEDKSVNVSMNKTQSLDNDELNQTSLSQPGQVEPIEISQDRTQLLKADLSTTMSQDPRHLIKTDKLAKKSSNMIVLDELAASCDQMTAELNEVVSKVSKTLHGVSAITVANVQTCETGVGDLGGTVDSAVKSMYSMIACSEELDREAKRVHEIAEKVKRIQTVLTALEENIL